MSTKVRSVCVAAALVFSLVAPGRAFSRPYQPGDAYVQSVDVRLLGPADDYPGMWEYVYDVYSGWASDLQWVHLTGFDGRPIANLHNGPDGEGLYQFWDGHTIGPHPYWPWSWVKDEYPSYWEDPDEDGFYEWIMPDPGHPNYAWRYLNLWHDGMAYNTSMWWRYPGTVDADGLHWYAYLSSGWYDGLVFTFRMVTPLAPAPEPIQWMTVTAGGTVVTGEIVGPGAPLPPEPPRIEALEVFYEGRSGSVADPAKTFLAVGQASQMSLAGDDLHGNVTNYLNGMTGIRVTFDRVVTFASDVSDAFSYEVTPEQSSDKTFSPFTPPTSPIYVVDDGTGRTVVTIIFMDGEIKNRWLKTIVDASQVSASGLDLDGELPSPLTLPSGDGTAGGNAELIIGHRFGDVDGNYRCLLNDAVLVRNHVSGAVVGISNAYDVDKNGRVLLNDAILTRNAVSGTALPTLP